MKGFSGRGRSVKRLFVVILLTLFGFGVFAAAYPFVAGAAGGNLAGY